MAVVWKNESLRTYAFRCTAVCLRCCFQYSLNIERRTSNQFDGRAEAAVSIMPCDRKYEVKDITCVKQSAVYKPDNLMFRRQCCNLAETYVSTLVGTIDVKMFLMVL